MNKNKYISLISDKLIFYLKSKLGNNEVNYDSVLEELPGGYSAQTYRFQLTGVENDLTMPLVLRLYPQSYDTNLVIFNSVIQKVLSDEGLPVPIVYFVETDETILGGPFFIMSYLHGQMLYTAPSKIIPELLGKTHAKLHGIDPLPLKKILNEKGFDETIYGLTSQYDWMSMQADELPWVREGVDWLLAHRPLEPEHLSLCHRDFHAANILYADSNVTGILDWGGLLITDPVFDVANTMMLHTISFKHLDDRTSVDWNEAADRYIAVYQQHKSLDSRNLSYYRAFRCMTVLIRGFIGLADHWRHPAIVNDLTKYIEDISGIRIIVPGSF